MSHDEETHETDRRTFLQAGALSPRPRPWRVAPALEAQDAPGQGRRACPGGSWARPASRSRCSTRGPCAASGLDRLLRFAFASGVRVFDTAKVYGSEPDFKKWFEQAPEVRKQIFLVTKDDRPRPPTRSSGCSTSGSRRPGPTTSTSSSSTARRPPPDDASTWSRARSSRRRSRRSGSRARPSSSASRPTTSDRAEFIQAAAEGGIVDAIMLQYSPWLDKDSPLNKALDAAHKAGIGLISMKQIAGQFGDGPREHPRRQSRHAAVPMLAERKLTPYQGLLHAIWTDERIAMCCVSMRQHRPDPRERRRRPALRAAQDGRDRAAPRRGARRRPDPLRRLRRPLLRRRRHQGRARQPDPVPDLPRAPRRPRRGPPAVRRAVPKPATGPAPTSKPPAPPAPTGSTSPSSCPRSIATWPEPVSAIGTCGPPEMRDLGGDSNITPEVDIIPIRQVNEAPELLLEPE